MAINLKAKPFYLSDEDIKWVEETLANLTLDEKIGQVFVDMLWNNTEEEVVERIQKYGMGGFRYNNMSPADLYKQNKVIQETSKIPALIAANIEAGGDGGVGGGTHFGHHVTIGATPIKEFVDQFDAVMLFVHVAGFSQSNVRRITWAMPMGPDIPWYVTELPTVCVSVFNPFHLIDVPMVPTYINAYSNDATLDLVIEKIMGKSEFKGVSSVDAFCGAWDTRL